MSAAGGWGRWLVGKLEAETGVVDWLGWIGEALDETPWRRSRTSSGAAVDDEGAARECVNVFVGGPEFGRV